MLNSKQSGFSLEDLLLHGQNGQSLNSLLLFLDLWWMWFGTAISNPSLRWLESRSDANTSPRFLQTFFFGISNKVYKIQIVVEPPEENLDTDDLLYEDTDKDKETEMSKSATNTNGRAGNNSIPKPPSSQSGNGGVKHWSFSAKTTCPFLPTTTTRSHHPRTKL